MNTTDPRQVAYRYADQAYSDYSTAIFTYVYWLVGNREQASGLVRQAFLGAFRTLPDTGTPQAFYLALLRIATRTVLVALDQEVCPTEQDADLGASTAGPPSAEPVQAALGSLPVRYRAVLLLAVQAKLSYNEMAQVLSRSPDDVRRNLTHVTMAILARYKLRSAFTMLGRTCLLTRHTLLREMSTLSSGT